MQSKLLAPWGRAIKYAKESENGVQESDRIGYEETLLCHTEDGDEDT
jgi:hypothetical protein